MLTLVSAGEHMLPSSKYVPPPKFNDGATASPGLFQDSLFKKQGVR